MVGINGIFVSQGVKIEQFIVRLLVISAVCAGPTMTSNVFNIVLYNNTVKWNLLSENEIRNPDFKFQIGARGEHFVHVPEEICCSHIKGKQIQHFCVHHIKIKYLAAFYRDRKLIAAFQFPGSRRLFTPCLQYI